MTWIILFSPNTRLVLNEKSLCTPALLSNHSQQFQSFIRGRCCPFFSNSISYVSYQNSRLLALKGQLFPFYMCTLLVHDVKPQIPSAHCMPLSTVCPNEVWQETNTISNFSTFFIQFVFSNVGWYCLFLVFFNPAKKADH